MARCAYCSQGPYNGPRTRPNRRHLGNSAYPSQCFSSRLRMISIARRGIFLIPLLLILPPALGLLGIQLAQPISDVCTCVFAYFIASRVIRELKGKADK